MSDETAPRGWINCEFGDVAKIRNGYAFKSEWFKKTKEFPDDVPLVRQSQLKGDRVDLSEAVYLAAHHLVEFQNFSIRSGDILIGMSGSIGKVCRYEEEVISLQNQRTGKIDLLYEGIVESRFMGLFLSTLERTLIEKAKGMGVQNISAKDIERLPFPLPPLAEQKRIVAKIEELFSELEAGEESLRVARRQLGVYRQSLLKQAFEGKLTAKWRTQNPSQLKSPTQLLARIQSTRQARYEQELEEWACELKQWEKSSQEEKRPAKPRRPHDVQLPARDQIENLPELPSAWAWISVANCAVDISDGPFGSNLKSDDYVSAGVRVVRLENIGPGEFIEEKESFISPEKYQKLKRHTVRPGDIVVASFINDAVRAALIPPSIEYAVNKADCFQVHCFGDTISSDFLVRCFGARYFFKQLEQLVHGVGRPRINTSQLGEAFVPLCPLPEQQEIVRLLDEQFEVIERNERELDAALKRSEALRQAILKKAFTGRLVPQSPADEPAQELLASLRAERAAAPTSKRKPTLQP